jgi:hypothetical protein
MLTHDPRVPSLTIEIKPTGSECEVRVDGLAVRKWSSAQKAIGRVPRPWGELGKQAEGTLAAFIDSSRRTLAMTWPGAGEAVGLLLDHGQLYWNAICEGRSLPFLERLQDSLNIIPMPLDASREGCYAYSASAPLIEVKCPRDTILPIEVLPLGLSSLALPAQTKQEVFQNAALLGGFACRIRYVFYAGDSQDDAPETVGGALPPTLSWPSPHFIGYLRSEDATNWDKMEEFFESGQLPAPMDGPYPRDGSINSANDLALYMLAPHLMAQTIAAPGEAAEPSGTSTLIHVQAHGRRGKTLGDAFFLEFERREGFWRRSKLIKVDLTHIQRALRKVRDLKGSIGTTSLFLNSCYSAGELGKELLSCCMMLTAEGIGGLVAPRDETPAGVAVELAQAYYRFLLSAGGTGNGNGDGVAIMAARLQLLTEFKNPLGLIYASYGHS